MPLKFEADERCHIRAGEYAGLDGTVQGPYGAAYVVELDGGRGPRFFKAGDLQRIAGGTAKPTVKPKGMTDRAWMNEICRGCGFKRAQCQCLELHLLRDILAAQLPEPIRNYRFSPRKYMADFAWPEMRLLVEVEGGGQRGHHQTVEGYENDCRKYNLAAKLGWLIIRFTGRMIKTGEALAELEEVLGHGTN